MVTTLQEARKAIKKIETALAEAMQGLVELKGALNPPHDLAERKRQDDTHPRANRANIYYNIKRPIPSLKEEPRRVRAGAS
jgi:hypothetical protein